jgi:hypothetical protein
MLSVLVVSHILQHLVCGPMLCTAVRGLPLVYNILFYLNIYFVVSLLSDQIECKQRQIHPSDEFDVVYI